jgi:hypothetical protein
LNQSKHDNNTSYLQYTLILIFRIKNNNDGSP